MCLRERANAAFYRRDIARWRRRPREPHDGLYDRERIAGAVIDLARQQQLSLFCLFALSDLDRDPTDPGDLPGAVTGHRACANAGANFAGRPQDASLELKRRTRADLAHHSFDTF